MGLENALIHFTIIVTIPKIHKKSFVTGAISEHLHPHKNFKSNARSNYSYTLFFDCSFTFEDLIWK